MSTKIIPYFVSNKANKTVYIEFDKIFGDPYLEKYNSFNMTFKTKRFYSDNSPIFVDGCNKILTKDKALAESLLYQYLLLKKAIDERQFNNYDNFIHYVINTLFVYRPKDGSRSILDLIRKHVNDEYIDHVDPSYEANASKFEQSIMFFKKHYKILFQLTSLSYFIIPLCMHFMYNNPNIDIEADTLIYTTMMEIMSIIEFTDEERDELADDDKEVTRINIYNKLFRQVQRYIERSKTSEERGMERLKIFGTTTDSIIETIMKKIFTDILPKYVFDKDIVKFNQTVIRTTFDVYILRKEDPIQTRCLIQDTDSYDSEEGGMDVFDRYNNPRDEKVNIYRKYLSTATINKIAEKHEIYISPEELKWYMKTIEINNLNSYLATLVLSREFEGAVNIYGCSKEDMIKGLIIVNKSMKRLGLETLSQLMVAKKINSVISKCQAKSLIKKIEAHPVYQDLINEKYKNVKELFIEKMNSKSEKGHPILNVMRNILNDTFVYNEYKHPLLGEQIPKNDDEILNEVLEMNRRMIW